MHGRRAARSTSRSRSTRSASRASTGSRYPILRFKDARRCTHGRTVQRSRTRPARATGSGEPPAAADPGRDRQRVLRRDGRAHPRGADDAGPRPRRAEGGGQVEGDGRKGEGPLTGPLPDRSGDRNVASSARLALLIGATAFALSAPGAQAASPPPLYVTYDANSNLSVSVAGGAALSSSSAIPPGPYWVTFDNEFSSERIVHKWHLVGPGVDVSTVGADLNCDSSIEQYIGVLQPSSTYTVQDDFHPALRPVVFRTSATGSSTSGQVGVPSPAGKSGPNVKNSDIVGSELLPYRGSLAAAVSAAGKLSLTRGGRPVSSTSLKAGRYTITVVDGSAKAGFTLKKVKPSKRTLALTSAAFVGRKSIRVQLGAGRWTFFSGAGAATRHFVVNT